MEIDAFLVRLEETRRRLRSARNAFLPVSQLPVEVLSSIFLYVIDSPKDCFSTPHTTHLRWVTDVCRHWRAVALGYSLLWTRIEVSGVHPSWTAEMLRRSKRSTIYFNASLFDAPRYAIEASQLVLAQADRIGEIHLSGDNKILETLLGPVIGKASRLKSLIVVNAGWKAGANIVRLHSSLFEGGAPQLEQIDLQKCSVPWGAPLLRSCPRVRTFSVEGTDSNRPPLPQLLGILDCMPRLNTLRLENVVPTSHNGGLPDDYVIPLNNLRQLILSGPTPDVTSLLTHLSFPPTTSMSLRCISSEKLEDLPFLIAVLSSRLSTLASNLPAHAFHISCDAVQLSMYAKTNNRISDDESLWDVADPGSISLSLIAGPEHLHTSDTLRTVAEAFVLKDVESLLVDDQEGLLDAESTCKLLARMPDLVTIHARHDAAACIVSALSTVSDKKAEHRSVLAPHLETLILEEVDMNWSFGTLPFMHALQEAQFVRCGYGQFIDELRVRRCMNIGAKDVGVLNHLFADVEWDAFEAYVSDVGSVHESEDWPDDGDVWGDYWEFEGVHWHS